MSEAPRLWAVVPAAGIGHRLGAEIPKQYLALGERRVIEHTLARLCSCPRLAGVVVVIAAGDRWWPQISVDFPLPPLTAQGGKERCHSVRNGLAALATRAAADDWVLVHDAARPCLCEADLLRLIDALLDHPVGGLLAAPVGDTLKRVNADGEVLETVSRDGLWRALTPQMFRFRRLSIALDTAIGAGAVVTDECQAIERFGALAAGQAPRVVPGSATNIKVTRREDLELAARYLGLGEPAGRR